MSPAAVDQRLRTVSDLRDLGLSLQNARRLHPGETFSLLPAAPPLPPDFPAELSPDGR